MLQYFTEKGPSYNEVLDAIKRKYGKHARIMSYRTVPHGGFLGFFAQEWVEITGFVRHNAELDEKSLEKEKNKILEAAAKENSSPSLDLVLSEVKSLRSQLEKDEQQTLSLHPSLQKMTSLLRENDFLEGYIEEIIQRIKSEFSLADLDDFANLEEEVLLWIGSEIRFYRDSVSKEGRKIFILVGPTGVGKTTTIAKLAAIYGIGHGVEETVSVCMITIDNYRIGAKKQIQTYGEIMNIPVKAVESYQALQDELALARDTHLVLVDTVGKSPKDFMKLAEMRELLRACGRDAEYHLAISATTKTHDMREIIKQYGPFGYKSLIITKLDETSCVGNILSVLHDMKLSVSYLTDGQVVPQNIDLANPVKFLDRLHGFRIRDRKNFLRRLKREIAKKSPSVVQ